MNIQHKNLASGRWFQLTLVEQLANIGSEIERTISWNKKNNLVYSQLAYDRALELIDLTLQDPKNRKRLKEIVRLREISADFFVFNNDYHSTSEQWQKYFLAFNYAARNKNKK